MNWGELKWCVVGFFLNANNINFSAMPTTLANVWKSIMKMKFRKAGLERFVFQFFHEWDLKRVLGNGPRSFDNHVLVSKELETREHPETVLLDRWIIWVQLHEIPMVFFLERLDREVRGKEAH